MEIETILKISSFSIGTITVGLAIWNAAQGHRKNLKDEYTFARDFFEYIERSKPHPLVRERGYQAVAGDSKITAMEVEYLLELTPSGKALRLYARGKKYLTHISTAGRFQVQYRAKYRNRLARLSRKIVYFVVYMISVFLSVLPLLFSARRLEEAGNILSNTIISCFVFLPIAFFVLREAVKISQAEELIEVQRTLQKG